MKIWRSEIDKYIEVFEEAKFEISGGLLKFKTIPDLQFLDALYEFSGEVEFFFPREKLLGDLVLIGGSSWSQNIRQAKVASDLFIEGFDQILMLSNVQKLTVQVKDGTFLDEDLLNWQSALMEFQNLVELDINILTKKTMRSRAKMETDNICSKIAPYFQHSNRKVNVSYKKWRVGN